MKNLKKKISYQEAARTVVNTRNNGLDISRLESTDEEKDSESSDERVQLGNEHYTGAINQSNQLDQQAHYNMFDVVFSHEYQEKIDGITTGSSEEIPGTAGSVVGLFAGQSIRSGIENANRQVRENHEQTIQWRCTQSECVIYRLSRKTKPTSLRQLKRYWTETWKRHHRIALIFKLRFAY